MLKIEKIISFLLYFWINSLFIYKYGSRQDFIPVFILLLSFPIFILSIKYFISKLKSSQVKVIYYTTTILFFIFTLIINFLIDENNLNVDRWSAMEIAISSIFENIYPYTAVDHLGGRSSNLPGLIIIGIPFYLLGSVGLLQSFSFLLFAYTIYKIITNEKAKLFGLVLLTSSVSFWWEVYVKSDLMSNFIIILNFLVLWYCKFKNDTINKPRFLGIIGGLLLLTRLVSIIPLTLLLFKPFLKSNFNKKIVFIGYAFITFTLLSFLVLKDCPSYDVFKVYNPFSLQNRQLPFFLSLFFILIPFYYSNKITSLTLLIKFSVVFISIPVITSFVLSFIKYSFHDIIHNSAFDLSYFNIISPFLIFYMIILLDKKYIEN